MQRREWLRLGMLTAAGMVTSGRVAAQQDGSGVASPSPRLADTSNLFAMDQGAARTVRRPPKPGALHSMTPDDRDALEHRIRCQCGCTLDVYTCRTTDFSCQVSPQMHRDVMSLVQGGYSEQEILDAFVETYGERVLMAPPKKGFNLLAYILPGSALAVGAIVLAMIIRRWRHPRGEPLGLRRATPRNATSEEMAELEAAIREDS